MKWEVVEGSFRWKSFCRMSFSLIKPQKALYQQFMNASLCSAQQLRPMHRLEILSHTQQKPTKTIKRKVLKEQSESFQFPNPKSRRALSEEWKRKKTIYRSILFNELLFVKRGAAIAQGNKSFIEKRLRQVLTGCDDVVVVVFLFAFFFSFRDMKKLN